MRAVKILVVFLCSALTAYQRNTKAENTAPPPETQLSGFAFRRLAGYNLSSRCHRLEVWHLTDSKPRSGCDRYASNKDVDLSSCPIFPVVRPALRLLEARTLRLVDSEFRFAVSIAAAISFARSFGLLFSAISNFADKSASSRCILR